MRKMLLVLFVLAVSLLARSYKLDRTLAPLYFMQPVAHVKGSDVAYTDSVYTVVHEGDTVPACGITVADSSTGGVLMVHMMLDGDTVHALIELAAGDHIGRVFTYIHERGTTIALADLIIWVNRVVKK